MFYTVLYVLLSICLLLLTIYCIIHCHNNIQIKRTESPLASEAIHTVLNIAMSTFCGMEDTSVQIISQDCSAILEKA